MYSLREKIETNQPSQFNMGKDIEYIEISYRKNSKITAYRMYKMNKDEVELYDKIIQFIELKIKQKANQL